MNYYNKHARTFFVVLVVAILFLLCAIRLINLQIINGESYRKVSEAKLYTSMTIKAPRGNIVDRYGEILATNRSGFSVTIKHTGLSRNELSKMLHKLVTILEGENAEFTYSLPVTKEMPYEFDFGNNDNIDDKVEKWLDKNNFNKGTAAPDVIKKLYDAYEIDASYEESDKRLICDIIYDMKQKGFSVYNPYVLLDDVSAEIVAVVKENSSQFSGVEVAESSVRAYPNGKMLAHVLGNVGIIYQEEYQKLKNKNYSMDALIGKQGVELAYESYLKGEDGIHGFEQTIEGFENVVTSVPAKQGNTVMLTIDRELQEVTEKALADTINSISQSVPDCNAGSVVCLDVNSGEILSIASYPSYYPNEYNKNYNSLIKNPANPVWNRAIGGAYEPGSTFKMLTAIASLEENIVTPSELILDEGKYKFYNDYQPTCMKWKTGETHGYVDVVTALQESCNYYFFDVGRRLGIEKLVEYSKKFGFGETTGIEVGGEVKGQIASPENKEKRGETWNPGDTLQASIGQSDNLITPIQLASYVATIANGGVRYQPHILKMVKDSNSGEVVEKSNINIVDRIEIDSKNLNAVKLGMKKVAEEGTASNVFEDFFVEIAGKTGTAEVSRGSNNGIFVAFAPYDNPQIAVAIVIEHGTGGYLAAPIAKAMFTQYFSNKEISDLYSVNTLNR
ncbi:MAG: penicillin-binding protein 2 [Clostridia bacterium]|nr:penicillin-binding protein 2 [Clostridia bacterium]